MDKSEYINELKLTILENSLLPEFLITKSLADILEIDFQDSYTLSDKSSSLSLASKIHLLIDLKNYLKSLKLNYSII